MWEPDLKPTHLTIESLKTCQQRRLERNRRESTSPINGIQGNDASSRPDPCLKSGSYLPMYGRQFFTPEFVNFPLEDFDLYYSDKETFVIVTEKNLLHRFSAQNALCIFSPFNPVRRRCISVLHHWTYRWFMIMIAFVDSCLLAQPYNDHQHLLFYFFGVTYTFDFVTNVIAKGLLLDPFTFLRDGWGIVYLLLLVLYYVPFLGRFHFLCGLRSLKIAALIPSLKSVVKAVLKTLVDLRDMLLWTSFATWIFALVGYHFYMGVSTQKCVLDFPEDGSVGDNRDLNWHAWVSNRSNWVYFDPARYYTCGYHSMTWKCPKNMSCLQVHDYDDKLYSSMDWALLSTILVMLQDSWDLIYFKILKSAGPWHAIYFAVTLFLGSFCTLNMIIAVVSKSYDDLQKEFELAENLERCRNKRSTSNISCSADSDAELGVLFKYFDLYCKNPINNIWTCWFVNLMNVIAFDPFTELTMAIATVGNLIVLSMNPFRVDENEQLDMILASGYQIFGIMFAVECLLNFLASGPISYFNDKWNVFGFWQTVLFLVEYKFEFNFRWMNALLSLRSLRIFKLTRIWPTLDYLLSRVFSAMGKVSDMTIVAIGIFYMFCVAGVHLFGGKIGTTYPESHWHFRDFWHSVIVLFRLLCGQWVDSMLECVVDHGWTCIPFFFSAFIVLDLIVLNLLLVKFLQRFSTRNVSNSLNRKSDMNKVDIAVNRFKRLGMWMKLKFGKCSGRNANRNIQPVSANREEQDIEEVASIPKKRFCGCPNLRTKMKIILSSEYFKYFNIGNTIIATICLSLRDAHLKSRPVLENVINVSENINLFFMAVEAALKILAMGFSAYLKNKWNCVDFVVLLGGILNIILSIAGFGTVGFFRSMRVLRLFSNFEGMRILFNSLGKAMSKLFGILMLCLLIWLVFAIIGVQLFNGRLHLCVNSNRTEVLNATIIRNKNECLLHNLTWDNHNQNFDKVGSAYYRILEIITFKGLGITFDMATGSGEIDELYSFERSFWFSGYFVAVILGGSFFAFNLFTGVLIDGLNEEKGKTKGKATKVRNEIGYSKAKKFMQDKLKRKLSSADTHTSKYQKFILGAVTSKHFGVVILLNLVFNMVLLTMEQRRANSRYKESLMVMNGICTAVFASECLLNMFALKCKFLRNPRHIFELLTELLSVFDILWTKVLLKTSLVPIRPGLLRLARFAWVSGFLRHFEVADGLRQILSVLQISLPAFCNICVLLILVGVIYALLGMELFKDLDLPLPFSTVLSFQTLPQAFIVLFPIITSANWNGLLLALSVENLCSNVNINTSGVCGNDTVAGIYVISYVFITYVILVNLYSAIILESYSRVMKLVECELVDEHFEMFHEIWSQFDTEDSHFIGYDQLSDLFESLKPPLQVSKPNQCAISLMNIPIYQGNRIRFADVLDAAITCLYFRKGVIPARYITQYQDEYENRRSFKHKIRSSTFQQQRQLRSAKIIQRAWRNQRNLDSE